jgi:hypothetical protein
MASMNKRKKNNRITHEGAQAHSINAYQELRRSVLSCLLWESQFYEDGISITQRIADLCQIVDSSKIKQLAIEARTKQHLRHVPLLLCVCLAAKGDLNSDTVNQIILRPDELTELLALYWMNGKKAIPAQMKKGLALSFKKFDEYQLAKYNRKKTVKLLDVMRLIHPKPENDSQAQLWKRLRDNELKVPDTWETALSGGADKKQTFERLMREKRLGGLAFLRNLRNMIESNVNKKIITDYMNIANFSRILPFRFIAAQMTNPSLTCELEKGMIRALSKEQKLKGKTILLVDVSGSMVGERISKRSELDRLKAASGVAILVREICEDIRIFTFSDNIAEIPNYHGFAIMDYIDKLDHSATYLGRAIEYLEQFNFDRLIIITDEQSHDKVKQPDGYKGYILNVASYKNGIGYGKWIHIDGWSESVIKFIQEYENY